MGKIEELEKRIERLEQQIGRAQTIVDRHTPLGPNGYYNPHREEIENEYSKEIFSDIAAERMNLDK